MSSMRSVLLAVLVWALAAVAPVSAVADPIPAYDGAMSFHSIEGPDGPEEFSWEVALDEDQELRLIDDRHAAVYWIEPEQLNLTIAAVAAHDAEGKAVPTTLAVTQPDVITLTVHHRSAPFLYPVIAGDGWEGGFQIHHVQGPPAEVSPPEPTCTVPDLSGRTLRASRKLLHRAGCKLGRVRGERNREGRVVKQYRLAGKSLPVWTAVDVKAS